MNAFMRKGIRYFATDHREKPQNYDLYRLYAHGGGDWEELAMRGIQLAIENSRPGSIIYVITDAPAKDYRLQVKYGKTQ